MVYNTTNGKKIDATTYGDKGTSITLNKANLLAGLYKAIHCSEAGARVVAVVPPVDAFGTTGSSGLGIAANGLDRVRDRRAQDHRARRRC